MARPKSEDKRNAILAAATRVFAERGMGATTAAISAAAGVAEGTLYTYFNTKDELVNALYRDIKVQLADAMMSSYPRKKSVRARLEHVWSSYVNWGVANPVEHAALAQIEVSDKLTAETKQAGSVAFAEIEVMVLDAISQHLLRDLPEGFAAAAMRGLAEETIRLIVQKPELAGEYLEAGFNVLWAGVTK